MRRLHVSILISLFLTGFAISSAYGAGDDEDWILFSSNVTGDRFYYTEQSIVLGQGKTAKVVQKVMSGQADSDIREVATVVEFDCPKLMYRRLKTATLSRSGDIRNVMEPVQWNSITPGSPTDILSQKVCARVKVRGRER